MSGNKNPDPTPTFPVVIDWKGYEWIPNNQWGIFHPSYPYHWQDPSAIEIDENQTLKLKTHYNPRPDLHPDIKVGYGFMSCLEKFSYGYFEIEAKLPIGPHLWPSFWMYAFESYPPEIDVVEAYSNKRGSYFNWSHSMLWGKFWRASSNFHLGVKGAQYQLGAKKGRLGWKSPSKSFKKYGLRWEENIIEIYYEGKIVRTITDEKTLSQYRGKHMNVLISTGLQKEHLETDITPTEFIVKDFKYEEI